MKGPSHSVYGGDKPPDVCGGAKPLGLWRGKATRSMERQSRSVYGGAKPLGLWVDKATLHIEGQSRWVYGRAGKTVVVCICAFCQ